MGISNCSSGIGFDERVLCLVNKKLMREVFGDYLLAYNDEKEKAPEVPLLNPLNG